MDYEKFKELTAKAMSDQTTLPVYTTISNAWMLVSGLQLATRHPDLSNLMKKRLEEIARQFQGAIVNLHPEVEEALEMGWHSEFDDLDDDDPDDSDMNHVWFSGKSVFDDDWDEDDDEFDDLDDDDGY